MPTMSKLIAAVLMAALGWFTADLVKPYLSEGTPTGMFSPVAAAVGVLVGWRFTGKKLQAGKGTAVAIGLTSSLLLVLITAAAFGGKEMVDRSLRKNYKGPFDAVQGFFDNTIENLLITLQADVLIALVVGGVIVGWLTAMGARKFL